MVYTFIPYTRELWLSALFCTIVLLVLAVTWHHVYFLFRPSSGTAFDDAFWLDLNYLEVAKVAQSCAAHFTALLYAEIYSDKKSMDEQEKR